jgi:hypothetical protein
VLIQTRSTSPSKPDACVPIKTESRASRNVCLSGGRMRATSRLVANVLRRWRLRLVFWVSARHNRHRPPPAHGHRNPVGRPDRRAPGPAARGGNYCRYPLCARLRRQITNVPSDSAASNGDPSRTYPSIGPILNYLWRNAFTSLTPRSTRTTRATRDQASSPTHAGTRAPGTAGRTRTPHASPRQDHRTGTHDQASLPSTDRGSAVDRSLNGR